MKEDWHILPLKGKYYGTIVRNRKTLQEVKFWCPDHFDWLPSLREIENGYDPVLDGRDHVEDNESYRLAELFCNSANNKGDQ